MTQLSIVEFARLSGVNHAVISRMVRDRRLPFVDGVDPEHIVAKSYLSTRLTRIHSDADIFCKAPKGWTLFYIEKESRRLPWCLFYGVERINYKKIIHLRCYNAFTINEDNATVTEKSSGIVFTVQSIEGE